MSVSTKKKPHWFLSEASHLLKGGVTSFRQPRFRTNQVNGLVSHLFSYMMIEETGEASYVLGLDYNGITNLFLSAQFFQSVLTEDHQGVSRDRWKIQSPCWRNTILRTKHGKLKSS